jgi:hypothetical protein
LRYYRNRERGFRAFCTARAAPVTAAAAATATPTCLAAFATFAIFRFRCCFLTIEVTAFVAARVMLVALFEASLATRDAFFEATDASFEAFLATFRTFLFIARLRLGFLMN